METPVELPRFWFEVQVTPIHQDGRELPTKTYYVEASDDGRVHVPGRAFLLRNTFIKYFSIRFRTISDRDVKGEWAPQL